MHKHKPPPVIDPETYFGRLKAKDFGTLLENFRESRLNHHQVEKYAGEQGGKLATLLEAEGYYWWYFYELPLVQCTGLLAVMLGWGEAIKEAAKKENPQRAFMDFVKTVDADEGENPLIKMEPAKQALTVNLLLATIYNTQAMGYYSLSINELLERAAGGDQEALKRAISVDRTVVSTPAAGKLIAVAQLRLNKAFMSGLWKRIKAPHTGRRTYADLRVIHRVLGEVNALTESSGERLLGLCGEFLGLYKVQGRGDALKGLQSRFSDWAKDSQPAKSADSSGSSPPV